MRFDQLAERAARHVARPWFFAAVAVVTLAWLPTVVAWAPDASDLLIDAVTNPLSLLLLVLLHNSQHRTERAMDARQDAMERGLALVLARMATREDDPAERDNLQDAAERLLRNAERTTVFANAELPREGPVDD